jgi:hypothetical protein
MTEASDWQRSERPLWVRALNQLGDPSWIALDPEALVAEAELRTGLSDFGSGSWRAGYRVFLEALEAEAQLNFVGRVLARSDVVNWLSNRLEMTQYAKQHPEIAQAQIEQPIFITGLPRTGTSILHELLAQDPRLRAPRAWEVRHPCPPLEASPAPGRQQQDPRIGMADEAVRLWCEIVPEYDQLHELGGEIPVECIQITAHSFRSDELSGRHVVPRYAAWLAEADLTPAYAFHKQMLQLLQSTQPARRWVLKAPSHLGGLSPLLAIYPDARIVWTHRDPLTVMASVASILFSTAWVRSDAVDPEQVLSWFTGPVCRHLIDTANDARAAHPGAADQFHDVIYEDLMAEPLATIGGIYTHFGMEFAEPTRAGIQRYLEAKPKARHGTHAYDFAAAAFDAAEERARFTDYQARYRIPNAG